MKYKERNGLRVSAFSLGTVQLGMNYGINNQVGKPSAEQAFAILDKAMELGVNHLDTANDYGDSERTIGQWLRTRKADNRPLVTTKIGQLDLTSEDALRRSVHTQVEGCLTRLDFDQIPILMLHNFEEYAQKPQWLQKIFRELKDEKLIGKSGISAYSRHDYGMIADSGFDAVQIPLNIFDWSKIDDGSMGKLEKAGMAVFVRSAFLQGLVFRDPEKLEPQMTFCYPTLKQFRALCQEFSMQPAELAVSFLLSRSEITSLVLGCETAAQIEANAALMEKVTELTADQMELVHNSFRSVDPRVLNPSTWFNATGSVKAK